MEDAEKRELIGIIGHLNNEIFDLKQPFENSTIKNTSLTNNNNNNNNNSFAETDFLETERNAMNEAYESEIKSLQSELQAEKESSNRIIDSLQTKINSLILQNSSLQNELSETGDRLNNFQTRLEEQQSINLALEEFQSISQNHNDQVVNNEENHSKSNERLELKITDLTNLLNQSQTEIERLNKQIQQDRCNFCEEIRKLNIENSQKLQNNYSNGSDEDKKDAEEQISQIAAMKKANNDLNNMLNREISERSRISRELHQKSIDFSKQMEKVQIENSMNKSVFTTLQSLFNTYDGGEIITTIQKMFSERSEYLKVRDNVSQIQRMLNNEIKKNEQLTFQLHTLCPQSPNNENHLRSRISQLENELQDLKYNQNQNTESHNIQIQQLTEKENMLSQNEHTIRTLHSEIDELKATNENMKNNYEQQLQSLIKEKDQQMEVFLKEQEAKQISSLESEELKYFVEKLQTENDQLKLENEKLNQLATKSDGYNDKKSNNSIIDIGDNTKNNKSDKDKNNDAYLELRERLVYTADMLGSIECKTQTTDNLINLITNIESDYFFDDLKTLTDMMNSDNFNNNVVTEKCLKFYDLFEDCYLYLTNISNVCDYLAKSIDSLYAKVNNLGAGSFVNSSNRSASTFLSLIDSPIVHNNRINRNTPPNSNISKASSRPAENSGKGTKVTKSRIPMANRPNGINPKFNEYRKNPSSVNSPSINCL